MKILALDSSSPVASVALVKVNGGTHQILFQESAAHARSDSSPLFIAMEKAVGACGIPDALCVGLGPGSYNGLRAGIAAARGFATALGIPLHAIPSPLALPGPDSGFWTAGDARGGHYWIACVRDGAFLEEPRLLSPQETIAHAATRPDLPILAGAPLAGFETLTIATPCAAQLAILAEKNDPLYLVFQTPEPLYLKPPHITSPKATATAPSPATDR